jgi:RNA polymerase sigma factor (sigma-70 family)
VAARARFVLWLGTHADMNAGRRPSQDSEANLRLVVSLAERYAGRGVPLSDLVQWGNAGLLRAAARYDPAKGYQFAAYATWWIRQAITRGLAGRPPSIPAQAPGTAPADGLTQAELRVRQALGREPTAEELAAELDPSV